jgi:hypothetical protein
VTPIVAEADLVLSAMLVAVMVNVPASADEKLAAVVEVEPKLPPVFVHVTPAFPWSFTTAAENVMV